MGQDHASEGNLSEVTSVGCRILVVDDEPSIRDLLRLMLEMQGYEVSTAPNGRVALDTLREDSSICLVLLDLMMPVMNGWEFYKAVRADEKVSGTPVVLVSAYASSGIDLPEAEVLEKPFDMDRLQELTGKYCRTKEAR